MCCEGKIKYRTPAEAAKVRKSMESRNQTQNRARNRKGLTVYRCDWCSFWHLGTMLRRASRREIKQSIPKSVRYSPPA